MPDADVARFDRRAGTYEQGWRAEFHARVVAATAELALRVTPQPQTVLDVGCGTGVLLRTLADQLPVGVELEGVDPAAGMVEVGRDSLAGRASVRIEQAPAEKLPFVDASFDLVISTVSFHHWADRRAGLREVARVLRRGGRLVLADHFAIGWLRVFDFVARRHLPAGQEVGGTGLQVLEWALRPRPAAADPGRSGREGGA